MQNTIPNNKIISNLNKLKIFASTNYWRILNKNADKITKNISASKMPKNSGGFLKIRRIYKIIALFKKSGGFPKSWHFSKNQVDFQNKGTCRKSGGLTV
jgi:hypothetical protein